MSRCTKPSGSICDLWSTSKSTNSLVYPLDWQHSRVHQALTTSRNAIKEARCEATRLLRWLADSCSFSRTGATACPDDHQCAPVSRLDHKLREVRPHSKSGLPVHWDAVQHSTIHSGAPTEDASQCPVRSPTLDDQSKHHSPWSAQITGHAGVHGFTGTMGRLRFRPV